MRGKEWYLQGESPAPGITPAYAGKRRCPRFRPGKIRDHPRVCGEKVSSTSPIKCLKGSPPRVRGKGQAACEIVVELGITPAYAGKRSYGCGTEQCGRDHPLTIIRVHHGITPAYAGKSAGSGHGGLCFWDHPRVCGEKTEYRALVTAHQGSPPRMRGKVFIGQVCIAPKGITPACAGKSLRPDNNPSTSWDHPRVCGEKTKKIP